MKALELYIFTFTFLLHKYESNCREIGSDQVLIVVSYDGFKNEYLKENVTPNMLEFRSQGVYADYMENVFPTKTFTNHFSIATGLYPGEHGVLANTLYDTVLGPLKYGYELFHYNPNILPIWALNEKAGGSSGCMMWPGSDFKYGNFTCTHMQIYNQSVPVRDRVDTVMSWLKEPKNPANLVMLYMEIPDKLEHAVGPESPQITEMVKDLDLVTKYIQDKLKENKLAHRTNVIHLSDHGMAGVNPPNFINLTSFLEPDTFKMYGTSPVLQVVPIEGKESDVYNKLSKGAADNGNFNVYKYDTLPARWHATNKRRFGPIIAVANLGYAFQDMWEAAVYYEKTYKVPISPSTFYGVHGYDNALPIMHPFFMAKGPAFRKEHKVNPFKTIDLFPLFCEILNIKDVPPTNGTFMNTVDLLFDDQQSNKIGIGGVVAIVLLSAIILAVIIFTVIYLKRKRGYFFVM